MLANNLPALRARKGWSQTDLANAIGTTLNTLGKLERGERPLSSDWLEKMARALDCAPFEIIAPADLLPSDEELADMLRLAQQRLPVDLPYSEWPRAVSGFLRTRLAMLVRDRARPASGDAAD